MRYSKILTTIFHSLTACCHSEAKPKNLGVGAQMLHPNLLGFSMTTILFLSVCSCFGYEFDANDFAIEWVSYEPGTEEIYTNPNTALGRPSIDTHQRFLSDPMRPVVPLCQPWEPNAVVTIGTNGYLVLKFNHRVSDDENNPFNIDFIVFGNAFPINNTYWNYGDPCLTIISTGQVYAEYGLVSVSQNGSTWYSFNNGPYADDFAPTLGRVFDPCNPYNGYPGWNNLWWSDVTNPTLPLDPYYIPSDFCGKSLAQMCSIYGESAGGTGFDLLYLDEQDYEALTTDSNTGRKWIQYIKIECTDPYEIYKPEIDAVSDVSCCGDYKHPFPGGDLSRDCRVDLLDFALFASQWYQQPGEPSGDIAPEDRDNFVDELDLKVLADNWLYCSWQCE